MTSDATGQVPGHHVAGGRTDDPEQVSEETLTQFLQVLRDKIREVQASEETRVEFVQMLLDKVRGDPYPSREQLDLIESSLPPEMVSDYARVLMDKASEEPFPSNEILRRIQRMIDPS